ncbi:hypothetical protein BFR80_013420 [Acinetobacter pittii]|uniref:hypothetical protein n=1 Tax=Acinetobacter pittii TaxID=48296 RepID=UPI00083887D9|nr:hypothetical protein [Acinetobacter pittii]MCK0925077.1 hypothetical protein [Acinetobacter pittii]
MDKKVLLEQFKGEVDVAGTSLTHILKMCEFDEDSNDFKSDTVHDYSVGCLNGAWWMYQREQAKVEGLQEEFAEDERFLKEQIKDKDLKISNLEYLQGMDNELIQTLQSKSGKLQKRVDLALLGINGVMRWIDEDAIDDADFIRGGVLSALRRLEQALKGEG